MRPIDDVRGMMFLSLGREILVGASMATSCSFAGWMVSRELSWMMDFMSWGEGLLLAGES